MIQTQRYLDLLAIVIFTALTVVAIFLKVPYLREITGSLLLLLFSGYPLTVMMFTNREKPGAPVLSAISVVMSVVVDIFMGLVLAVTPWGFTFESIIILLPCFTITMSGIAWYLRYRQSGRENFEENPLSFFTEAVRSVKTGSWEFRGLVFILIAILICGLASFSFIVTKPVPEQPFSEFYILGENGQAGDYPTVLSIGEEGSVYLTIVNHEIEETGFSVEITIDGNLIYTIPGITLQPGDKWQQPVSFVIREAGENQKVEFILNKNGNPGYEILYIWVDVAA